MSNRTDKKARLGVFDAGKYAEADGRCPIAEVTAALTEILSAELDCLGKNSLTKRVLNGLGVAG